MTDSYVIAHNTWNMISHVQHAIILDVGMMSYDNTINIAAQYRITPDACRTAQGHIAQHKCTWRNVHSQTELWLRQQGSRQPFFEADHSPFIEDSRPDVDKKQPRRAKPGGVGLTPAITIYRAYDKDDGDDVHATHGHS